MENILQSLGPYVIENYDVAQHGTDIVFCIVAGAGVLVAAVLFVIGMGVALIVFSMSLLIN